jgi:hypothetical protein
MLNKLEQKLDRGFDALGTGVIPYIYHFRNKLFRFRAITIADPVDVLWKTMDEMVDRVFLEEKMWQVPYFPATKILTALRRRGIYGVAICDSRDQFNKQRGRIIAKGRLLKHLKEIAK